MASVVVQVETDLDRRYREGKIGLEEYARLKKQQIKRKVNGRLSAAARARSAKHAKGR